MKITTNSLNIFRKKIAKTPTNTNQNHKNNLSFSANKMSYKQGNFLKNELTKTSKIDIFCHETTDKDSINSALAMAEFLKSKGVKPKIIISGSKKALDIHNKEFEIVQADEFIKKQKTNAKTVLCVDFNSKSRVSPQIAKYIQKSDKIFGLDHHCGIDIVDGNYTYLTKPLNSPDDAPSVSSYYVDTSAKSATAVVYRFLESIDEEITNSQAYELFSGLLSDCAKKALIYCDGKRGTIEPTQSFIKDKNSFEIYEKLKSKLSEKQLKQIARNIDITANLNPEEEKFKNSLKKRLVLSKNKKIAYVEIPLDDKAWKKVKEDNPTTSTILNRFRQDVLNNRFNDKNLDDVQSVFVFYKAKNNYRLSAHSKDDKLLDFFKYAQTKTTKKIPQSMGGHPTRGGGRILSTDPAICHQWVMDIISASDFYDEK